MSTQPNDAGIRPFARSRCEINMIRRYVPVAASLVTALLPLSCTRVAYPGPRLPNESVATVQPDRTGLCLTGYAF